MFIACFKRHAVKLSVVSSTLEQLGFNFSRTDLNDVPRQNSVKMKLKVVVTKSPDQNLNINNL